MYNKGIDCIQCNHYAVCRYKENMSEVKETINKMRHNDKNKNLDITVDCVYYSQDGKFTDVDFRTSTRLADAVQKINSEV